MIPKISKQTPQEYYIADKNPDMMKQLPALSSICEYMGEGYIYAIEGVVQQYKKRGMRVERLHFWKKKDNPLTLKNN